MLSLAVASLATWTSTGPCEVVGTCVQSSGYPLQYGTKESCTIVMDPPGAITIHSFRTYSYLPSPRKGSARGLAGERKGSGTPRKGSAREVQGTAGLLRQYSEQI